MKFVSSLLHGALAAKSGNMNGKYSVTSISDLDAQWNDDYASKGHEYFDVWAPEMSTHYGQVFWTDQGNNAIPEAIVKRFAGKVMAITGYEQDQVMVTPRGKPGLNPEKDVSVPINWAYNHHYMAWMTGKHSEMQIKTITDKDELWENHGKPTKMVAVEKPGPRNFADVAPTSQMFSEGNGGESRKSFHGYPDGFAQLIESPTTWHITPMQIDTRNRDCGVNQTDVTKCTEFTPGIEPRQARYGRGWAGVNSTQPVGSSNYSGVLECPCNSAYGGDPMFYPHAKSKITEDAFQALPSGTCGKGQSVATADMCFAKVPTMGIFATAFTNKSVSDDKTVPAGCSVVTNADGTATAYFNTGAGGAAPTKQASHHGEAVTLAWSEHTANKGVTLKLDLAESGAPTMSHQPKGKYCSQNHAGVIKSFPATTMAAADLTAALNGCEAYCKADAACTACSVDMTAGAPGAANERVRWVAIPACGSLLSWAGAIAGDVSQKSSSGIATVTMTGPADVWFGVGFDAQIMSDKPYTLVANASGVFEQKIGTCGSEAEHCPGTLLAPSVTLKSNTAVAGVRTVVVTRTYEGKTADHYTFNPAAKASINFIAAVGKTGEFAYHVAHDSSVITVTTAGVPTPVCNLGGAGQLCAYGGTSCGHFTKNCAHSDGKGMGGDLFDQHNPTCNSNQYSGGLSCCHHNRIMLDEDQIQQHSLDRPTLNYHMKFRFWFKEYVPSGSKVTPQGTTKNTTANYYNLPRIYFQTEANAGEYDIPPAFATKKDPLIPGYPGWPVSTSPADLHLTPGTTCTGTCPGGDDCKCAHTITYNHTVSNMRLIYAGGHCHAPACIGIWLYRNDPGHEMELLCHQHPIYGTGDVLESKGGDKYDEAGYLALPPCLWGDDAGLHPSVLLPRNTELVSIKKNWNHDTGHFGEMASWQMRGINF